MIALLLASGCGDDVVGGAGLLDGDPDDPVEGAVPTIPFEPSEDSDPTNTLLLSFELGVNVGEANMVLGRVGGEIVGGFSGAVGEAKGLLVLRTPTETAEEMAEVVADLRGDPTVAIAVQDAWLLPQQATAPPQGNELRGLWTWEQPPAGYNWGHELTRIPQMWNLVDGVRKRGEPVPVGVVDLGFATSHPDLDFTWDGAADDHGAMTSGIIAAKWGNAFGIDGVTPHAAISLHKSTTIAAALTDGVPEAISAGAKVVNISLGHNWTLQGIDIGADFGAQKDAIAQGGTFMALMAAQTVKTGGALPQFVVSAGNDSTAATPQDARFNSPWATAALEFGAANVIVVESFMGQGNQPGAAINATDSNRFGHISAPGFFATSTTKDGGFESGSGTSLAAPFIAGLAAFMYAVEPDLPQPTLGQNVVRDLMLANDVAIGGAGASRMDAFAAVMAIDGHTGGDAVLRMLCDVDDGTVDGNTRVDLVTGAVVADQDVDADGGLGDGNVDMADFRRFRDWALAVAGNGQLDGAADNPKRDLNLDTVIDPAAQEWYPRGDFNGDGLLNTTSKAYVPGAIGADVTDLDVLKARFSDAEYKAADLDALMESGDLHVDLDECFAREEVTNVSVTALDSGNEVRSGSYGFDLTNEHILTLPPATYTVEVEAVSATGAILMEGQVEIVLASAGQDVRYSPNCGGPLGDWIVTPIDALGATQLNDVGQVLSFPGADMWTLREPDGSTSVLDAGSSYRLMPSGGTIRHPAINADLQGAEFNCPLQFMSVDALSPSGVVAGSCWTQGQPKQAWMYLGAPDDGPPVPVLEAHTEGWLEFGTGNGHPAQSDMSHAVNDSGVWVGYAEPAVGEPGLPAILTGSDPEWLPMPAGYTSGSAQLINSGGTMAGVVAGPMGNVAVLWEGGAPRVVSLEGVDYNRVYLLGDDNTLIVSGSTVGVYSILPPGGDELEPLPDRFTVVAEDGTESSHALLKIQDINGSGQLLVRAEGATPASPLTLILTRS